MSFVAALQEIRLKRKLKLERLLIAELNQSLIFKEGSVQVNSVKIYYNIFIPFAEPDVCCLRPIYCIGEIGFGVHLLVCSRRHNILFEFSFIFAQK